jgi:PIN domain nuclease of toxin-antitoxin system
LRLLLDTATLIWWVMGSQRLSLAACRAIEGAETVHVSAITAMELSTKFRIGKLPEAALLVSEFHDRMVDENFLPLPLEAAHALLAGQIDAAHRDPFDRMLAAQARVEQLAVVSPDTAFDVLGAQRIW